MSQQTRDDAAHAHPRLRLPRAGDLAPAFALPATDGATVELAGAAKPLALVFLRHLM
ncbi:MAG TPA: hypothetical protein VIG30_02235 [Ktedonobacterales bacterium]|jgi:hypothetical protein